MNIRGQEKRDKIGKIKEFDNLPNSSVQPWGRNIQSNICKNLPQQPANVQQPTTSEFVKGSPSMNDLKGKKKNNNNNKKNSMMSLNQGDL